MSNNYYKEMVRLADSIADKAHEGQTDRNGWPYISHPRRVALGHVSLCLKWLPPLIPIRLWRN